MESARALLRKLSQMLMRILAEHYGTHDGAHRRRQYRTLIAGAAGVVGLVLLVIAFGTMSISYGSGATASDRPAGPATPKATPKNRGPVQVSGAKVVRAAAEQRGHPYKYGAAGPKSFDCSGFTKFVYAQFGVRLPHNAAAQYRAVKHVAKADMRRGDLIFFRDRSGVYHVGIYAGGKQMWAAANPHEDVVKQRIWTGRYLVGRP